MTPTPSWRDLQTAAAADRAQTVRRARTARERRLTLLGQDRPISDGHRQAGWLLAQLPPEDPLDIARRRAVLTGYEPAEEGA
jgi:hypothetical protein